MAQKLLTGIRNVRVIRPALHDAKMWLPKMKDRFTLRRHALKLRFWPESTPTDEIGTLLDVDWSWVRAMRGLNVGELRVSDTIGGHNNLRVIFYDTSDIMKNYTEESTLPILWILSVFQKKRDDFSQHNISTFRLRRQLVRNRFYDL